MDSYTPHSISWLIGQIIDQPCPGIPIRAIPPGIMAETLLLSLPVSAKKAQLKIFSSIQVTPSLSPVFWSENRKTSLQDLIALNNLGIPNKRKVLCPDFCLN